MLMELYDSICYYFSLTVRYRFDNNVPPPPLLTFDFYMERQCGRVSEWAEICRFIQIRSSRSAAATSAVEEEEENRRRPFQYYRYYYTLELL